MGVLKGFWYPVPNLYRRQACAHPTLYVKGRGMGEKMKAKRTNNVLIRSYRILRAVRVGQDFSVRYLSISSRVYPTAYAAYIV